ncbi:MAG: NYN domain-containing protein [Chloroflexi bacterium]|nr:NYN domain-containing protein [Chloroflexota bacterium]
MMYVLVDYDNIDRNIRVKGAKYALERITSKLCKHVPDLPRGLMFRLYGGWYNQTSMTKYAQDLSLQLTNNFPYVFRPIPPAKTVKPLVLQATLARALLIDPTNNLLHTFRERARPRLRVKSPKSLGCSQGDCGLRHLEALSKKGKCPEPGCSVTIQDIIVKKEQKLVDVMLASDLLYLAETQSHNLTVVVTSDEDLWPAIQQALIKKNKSLIHVQAKSNHHTPTYYSHLVNIMYTEITI